MILKYILFSNCNSLLNCRDPLEARITIFIVRRKDHLKNHFLINFEWVLRNLSRKLAGNSNFKLEIVEFPYLYQNFINTIFFIRSWILILLNKKISRKMLCVFVVDRGSKAMRATSLAHTVSLKHTIKTPTHTFYLALLTHTFFLALYFS
jgi:hypothetical protein